MLGLTIFAHSCLHSSASIWDFGVAIQESQLVAICRFNSFLGTTTSYVYTNDNNLVTDLEPVQEHKIRFNSVLICSSTAPSEFDYVVPFAAVNRSAPWSRSGITWGPRDVGLIFCDRVASNGHWPISDETYIQVDPGSYLNDHFADHQVKLPDISYVREGNTAVQRLISVFAQSYAADPDKNEYCLHYMGELFPSWTKNKDGTVRLTEDGFKDQNVYAFFLETVYPRLVRAAGNDPVKKLRAEWYACCAGNPANNAKYKTMLDDLERTYPRPDEPNLIEGLAVPDEFNTREYWLSKTHSRLSTVRRCAISLTHLDTDRRNLSRILEMLDDPSSEVLERTVDWLRHMKDDHYDLYKDAPNIQFDGRIIKNKSEVVEYWTGR